ncbi:MAG: PAS domain-containing protein [Hyphomicrobiales bacterium]
MEHATSRQIYHYWNLVRGGRKAPERFEIEPAQIAGALPQTFVLECASYRRYPFRLAGTRICTQFGMEMRGTDLMELWTGDDREAADTLLHNVVEECAAAVLVFDSLREDGRSLRSEMVLLPLLHGSRKVNRIIGAISPAEDPYWLGTAPFASHSLAAFDLIWPDGKPRSVANEETLRGALPEPVAVTLDGKRKFRVYEGGRSGQA